MWLVGWQIGPGKKKNPISWFKKQDSVMHSLATSELGLAPSGNNELVSTYFLVKSIIVPPPGRRKQKRNEITLA